MIETPNGYKSPVPLAVQLQPIAKRDRTQCPSLKMRPVNKSIGILPPPLTSSPSIMGVPVRTIVVVSPWYNIAENIGSRSQLECPVFLDVCPTIHASHASNGDDTLDVLRAYSPPSIVRALPHPSPPLSARHDTGTEVDVYVARSHPNQPASLANMESGGRGDLHRKPARELGHHRHLAPVRVPRW